MSTEPLTLTLDIGTSSTRALIWDKTGREIEGVRAQTPYQMHTTQDGGVEMPAEELLTHVGTCLDQALAQAGERAKSLHAVGISTYWHALLGLDKDGNALTPVYNWADTRSAEAARRLRSQLDGKAIHARTGCVLHPSYYPAKLVWLRDSQPELFARVARWVSPSEYLFGRLFGMEACRVSISMASGTGLLNQESCEWDTETLQAIQLPIEKLSPIVDLKHPSQGLQEEFARRWPALRDVPFFPAVGDGACGNVGSGCVSPERFAINVGTSGAIRAVWEEGKAHSKSPTATPAGLWRYRVDARRPILGAAFSDGGVVYAWMTHRLQLPPADELERQLAAMEPGAHGLTFLPFLAGERSFGWDLNAQAALVGLNLDTSPVEILRAAMEAVAQQFALAAEQMHTVFPKAQEIIASGGALGNSPAWTQMFADALGQPVTLAEEPEASSRGAALLAMEAAGILSRTAEAKARLGQTFQPNAAHHARYVEMRARQQDLYAKLIQTS
jgi:gluconokinase